MADASRRAGLIRPRSSIAPRRTRPRTFRGAGAGRQWTIAYPFILPVLGLTVLFSVVPLVMVIRRSLYSGNVFDINLKFSGLANYRQVFTTGGGHSLIVTVVYTVLFVAVCMILGLAIALLLDNKLRGLSSVRAFFVIPLVVPTVATAFIWFALFQPNTGFINRIFLDVGIPQVSLASETTALVAVVSFGAWQFFGEIVLLYLAALKSLPSDVVEAAAVDGAGSWKRFRYIRLPLLRQQTGLIAVVATLQGLQAFAQIFVLTNGGPNGATQTALYYVYEQYFVLGSAGSEGRADAMAVILFLISILVTLVQLAIVGRASRAEGA